MKKLYSLFAVAALAFTANAQTLLFENANFENFDAFKNNLGNQYGLKFISAAPGEGINGSNAIKMINVTETGNGYNFTVNNVNHLDNGQPIKYITLKVKGTAEGVSFNSPASVNNENNFYNVQPGTNSNVTLTVSKNNSYTGTIDATDWITITLELNQPLTQGALFALKFKKSGKYNLLIDDIYGHASEETLSTIDFGTAKNSMLVKNTQVADQLVFGNEADVKIINMNGQVVKSAKVAEGTTMNVSSLTPGMYIVTGSVNGKAVSQKIIKK